MTNKEAAAVRKNLEELKIKLEKEWAENKERIFAPDFLGSRDARIRVSADITSEINEIDKLLQCLARDLDSERNPHGEKWR